MTFKPQLICVLVSVKFFWNLFFTSATILSSLRELTSLNSEARVRYYSR